jgi:hypothetical protein
MTDDHRLELEIATIIGRGDMGPGISLSSALVLGMDSYYPDNRKGAANCVAWALQQAARAVLATLRDRDAAPRKAEGFEAEGQQPGPEGDRPNTAAERPS